MNELYYAFYLAGGFSTGYSLLRTGFPSAQGKKSSFKLGAGYALGAVVFGLPAALAFFGLIGTNYFFAASLIMYAALFLVLYAKRTFLHEQDPLIVKESKKKRLPIPKSILTKEEMERKGITDTKKINFEDGLIVGTRQYATKPEEIKKQVFKEKNDIILNAIGKKTKEIESKNSEAAKREMLSRLKEAAKEIERKKKTELEKAEEMNSIEENLLSNMDDK